MKKTVLTVAVTTVAAFFLAGCNHSGDAKPEHKAGAHAKHEKDWNYTNNGPSHWEEFSKTCGVGQEQSPINIMSGKTVAMDLSYSLGLHEDKTSMSKIVDNGHDIEVIPKNPGFITLHGARFNLLQFHFHGKSEHTIDGKRYDLVAHMVHQNPITKQYAVVTVLFKEGKANPLLEKVIDNVGGNEEIDPQDLLPADQADYYHYVGSFTTPPCTENVEWYIFKTPMTASAEQIAHFRKYYLNDERPIQKLNGRVVESK